MKKFFDIVMPVKTAACYIFTATMCVYAVLDLVFGWGGLPCNYLFSFLRCRWRAACCRSSRLQSLLSKGCAIRCGCSYLQCRIWRCFRPLPPGFGWLPAAPARAPWALFFLIFLAVLLTMTLGFELYYRISGKKYDGLLGQYRASRTRMKTAGENTDACGGKPDERNEKFSTKEACAVENRTGPFRLS